MREAGTGFAILKRVTHGKMKGQYRFVLKGINGEVIAVSETYTQKHNAVDIIKSYFVMFEFVDNGK